MLQWKGIRKNMSDGSLRSKILLILWGAIMCSAILTFQVQRWFIYPHFESLERDHAITVANQFKNSIEREIEFLDAVCQDWSAWDATCAYMHGTEPEFLTKEFAHGILQNNHINLMCILDSEDSIIWEACYDKQFQPGFVPSQVQQLLKRNHSFITHTARSTLVLLHP